MLGSFQTETHTEPVRLVDAGCGVNFLCAVAGGAEISVSGSNCGLAFQSTKCPPKPSAQSIAEQLCWTMTASHGDAAGLTDLDGWVLLHVCWSIAGIVV